MGERVRNVPPKYQGKTIYSISRLLSFNDCQYGYYLNYVLRGRGSGNIYSILGGKVHELLELMQFGQLSNEDALKQFENALFETIEILGHKFTSDKVHKNFIDSITHFIQYYKPMDVKNFKSELEFYTDIQGIPLVGYIDAVVLNHDDTVEVVDYKTSSKYQAKDLTKHGYQLVLYAMALEKEYGIKVSKVKWNMLKYCTVRWQGATKPREGFYLRSEVVAKLRTELKKDLRKDGMSEAEIELLLAKAEETNNMSLLPQGIQDKYEISDGYIEYCIDNKTKKGLEDFIIDTVRTIENKDINDESKWIAKDISKDNFFCGILCDFKSSCPHYIKYLDQLKLEGQVAPMINSIDEEVKRLFG